MCRLLNVSRSAYYQWLQTGKERDAGEKKKTLEERIVRIFQEHRRRYGVRRMVAELQANGIAAVAYQVRKVLQDKGLKAIQPCSFVPRTTDSRHPYSISANLLQERAAPIKPNEVWVGDITYIPMVNGVFLYLSVWMDLYSRRIVGWQLEAHMKEELIVAAFRKALLSRSPNQGMIVHSDRGGQYAGNKFRKMINDNKLLQSMSRADNPYDNAFMESCFSRFKTELLQGGTFQNGEDVQTEIFEFIEMYYNTKRRHSSLHYLSPMTFENNYYFYQT